MTAAPYNPPPIRDFEAPQLEAVVEVMFLAAFADGDFGEEEKAHFLRSIESLTDRSLTGETLERLVTRIHGELSAEGRADAPRRRPYSTVTVLARLRGWSTFRPRRRAIR